MDFNKRVNILKGQLEGIRKMIEDEKDCVLVMQQIKAVKSGLNKFTKEFMSHHFRGCLADKEPDMGKIDDALKALFTF